MLNDIQQLKIADLIDDHVFIKDLNHNYVSCNKAFSNFAGFDNTDIKGKNDFQIFSKEKADLFRDKDDMVIENGKTIKYQSWYEFKDGNLVLFETKKSPLIDENGKIIGVIGISRDITDTVKNEQKYKSNFRRLEQLIKHLNSGILVENEKRQILVINQNFLDIFGLNADIKDLIGTDCSNAAEMVKDLTKDPDQFILDIEEILSEHKAVTGQIVEFKDGRYLKRDYIPVHNNDIFLGQMWIYSDITSQKNHEKEKEEMIKQLSESNQRIARNAQRMALLAEKLDLSNEFLEELNDDLSDFVD
jgi:PAS domain S-box-containing protein